MLRRCSAGLGALIVGLLLGGLLLGPFPLAALIWSAGEAPVTVRGALSSGSLGGAAGGTLGFDEVTSGVNSTATFLVGTGGSLGVTGSGTITATDYNGTLGFNRLTGAILTAQTLTCGNGCLITTSGTGEIIATNTLGGGTSSFTDVTTGVNTTATMTVGTGASILPSGSGVINATQLGGTAAASYPTLTSTSILTNKQIVLRDAAPTVTANAITPNCDTTDLVVVDSLSADLTINNPSPCTGSNPRNGQRLEFRLKSATSRVLTWDTGYTAGAGLALVTSTTGNGVVADRFLYEYNTTTAKWEQTATTKFPLLTFTVTKNLPVTGVKFPTTNAARLDRSGETDKLLFDATTSQCVSWQFFWPSDYTSGGTFKLNGSMASATSGSVNYDVSVWKLTPGASVDVDTTSFDTANTCNTATVPGTAGFPFTVSCTLTNKDSVAAGDNVVLKLCRNIGDTATGDGEVGFAELSYVH